jgi:hypothetical protein
MLAQKHGMAMAVSCQIKIGAAPQTMRVQTFQEVPRVGEFVTFSRDGKRDENGVLQNGLFQVQRVIHAAASDLSPATIIIDVLLVQPDAAG